MVLHPKREYMPTDAFHLEHRCLHGMRFDGVCAFRDGSAEKCSLLLEAAFAKAAHDSSEGTLWCEPRCTAVMVGQAVQITRRAKHRELHSKSKEVCNPVTQCD